VVGQLAQARAHICAVQALDCLAYALVQLHAGVEGEALINDLAHERVREAKATAR
jgi:hypothetical protein